MKGKPTIESLRQGQTVYVVSYDIFCDQIFIYKYFLCSHKHPESHFDQELMKRISVTVAKRKIKRLGNKNVFYSYKKAKTFKKLQGVKLGKEFAYKAS